MIPFFKKIIGFTVVSRFYVGLKKYAKRYNCFYYESINLCVKILTWLSSTLSPNFL